MIIEHTGKRPRIDPSAWVAPDATVCGDVTIEAGARVLHGARLIGEAGGRISIGRETIVMENAVVRATSLHACAIGANCLIGPGAHVVGATVADQVFIATGAAIFHGALLGRGAEVPGACNRPFAHAARRRRHGADRLDCGRRSGATVFSGPARCDLGGATRVELPAIRLRNRARHAGLDAGDHATPLRRARCASRRRCSLITDS